MQNSPVSLTGHVVTVTDLPIDGGWATAPEFTAEVLNSCFYLNEGVNAVEVMVPNRGRQTVFLHWVTAVS